MLADGTTTTTTNTRRARCVPSLRPLSSSSLSLGWFDIESDPEPLVTPLPTTSPPSPPPPSTQLVPRPSSPALQEIEGQPATVVPTPSSSSSRESLLTHVDVRSTWLRMHRAWHPSSSSSASSNSNNSKKAPSVVPSSSPVHLAPAAASEVSKPKPRPPRKQQQQQQQFEGNGMLVQRVASAREPPRSMSIGGGVGGLVGGAGGWMELTNKCASLYRAYSQVSVLSPAKAGGGGLAAIASAMGGAGAGGGGSHMSWLSTLFTALPLLMHQDRHRGGGFAPLSPAMMMPLPGRGGGGGPAKDPAEADLQKALDESFEEHYGKAYNDDIGARGRRRVGKDQPALVPADIHLELGDPPKDPTYTCPICCMEHVEDDDDQEWATYPCCGKLIHRMCALENARYRTQCPMCQRDLRVR